MNKPVFYVISLVYLILIFGLCKFFNFNLFSFNILNRKEIFIILIGFTIQQILTFLLTSYTTGVNNEEGLEQLTTQTNIFFLIITMSIFIPIIEEYIFRGIIIKILFQKKQWIGAIISIIVFTLAHSPKGILEYLIFGLSSIIYVVTYQKTQRIEVPILIHILNNLIASIY